MHRAHIALELVSEAFGRRPVQVQAQRAARVLMDVHAQLRQRAFALAKHSRREHALNGGLQGSEGRLTLEKAGAHEVFQRRVYRFQRIGRAVGMGF